MPATAPRGRANSAAKNATIIPGNSHLRHEATFARPGGTGEDVRISELLRVPGGTASGNVMVAQRPRRDHLDWLYSDTRGAAGRRAAATLAAWIRACQAPRATSRTSRMITDSTLSAVMSSGQCQLPTSP